MYFTVASLAFLSVHEGSLYPSPAVFSTFLGRSWPAVEHSGEFQQVALISQSVTFLSMAIYIFKYVL